MLTLTFDLLNLKNIPRVTLSIQNLCTKSELFTSLPSSYMSPNRTYKRKKICWLYDLDLWGFSCANPLQVAFCGAIFITKFENRMATPFAARCYALARPMPSRGVCPSLCPSDTFVYVSKLNAYSKAHNSSFSIPNVMAIFDGDPLEQKSRFSTNIWLWHRWLLDRRMTFRWWSKAAFVCRGRRTTKRLASVNVVYDLWQKASTFRRKQQIRI